MDSLNIYDPLILLKFLNVKNNMFSIARCCQKTRESPPATYVLSGYSFSNGAKSHRFHCRLYLSCLPGFLNFRLVFEFHIQCWQSGWCVTQGIKLGDTGSQSKLVNNVVHSPRWQKSRYAWYSACCDLRASSRSTVFIIDEGPVSAFFLKTVKWRNTASLNLNACSSSTITA